MSHGTDMHGANASSGDEFVSQSDHDDDAVLRMKRSYAANKRWSGLTAEERLAATQPGRDAAMEKWIKAADGDVKRAESMRKAHFQFMAIKSAEVRRAKREMEEREAELRRLGVL